MPRKSSKTTVREHERTRPSRREKDPVKSVNDQIIDAFRRENNSNQEGFREWVPVKDSK